MKNTLLRDDREPLYRLRKSRDILSRYNSWYRRKWKTLPEDRLRALENMLANLDAAVSHEDQQEASHWAHQLQAFANEHCRRSPAAYLLEVVVALVIALAVAIVIRQMWFELYEVPTGSMRPTIEEKDRLIVSKTTYGLNIPMTTGHFYFDPSLVRRTGVVIWSGANVDLPDLRDTYMGFIPYTRKFVKRMIGLPGDSLYFYGGQIYGVDKTGKEVTEWREAPWMTSLEHIPISSFEGKVTLLTSPDSGKQLLFRLFNQPFGRLSFSSPNHAEAQVFLNHQWVKEGAAETAGVNHVSYGDFFGIRNYAMARLLTYEQALTQQDVDLSALPRGVLYLQLCHNPSLSSGSATSSKVYERRGFLLLQTHQTLIPLQEAHLQAIMDHMYTARFVVKEGIARPYSAVARDYAGPLPVYPGVPDGTYEFYHGQAARVGWGGWSTPLPADHPLCQRTPENVQRLFNLGIEWRAAYQPEQVSYPLYPTRFAYFRNGDLYLLGASVIKQGDPLLSAFEAQETARERASSKDHPYAAFKDYGPPVKEGKIDVERIRALGVTVPEHHYLVLGDNHAMSLDSRFFGFVPEDNLEGTAVMTVWPPQGRFGPLPQAPAPWWNAPSVIVWAMVLLIVTVVWVLSRRKKQEDIFQKLS